MKYPQMHRLCQVFDAPKIVDLEKTVLSELEAIAIRQQIQPGDRIGITAGSRGIAGIDTILKTIIDFLKECKADPFLFPAMGSHGGGTAQGQREILASLKITEDTMGVPILASMEISTTKRL